MRYEIAYSWRVLHKSYHKVEPLFDALDRIFMERGDAEAKGVRDQLLQPEIICMLLLLAEVLSPINIFSKYLQTSTLYCDVGAKLDRLLQRLHLIKDSLKDHHSVDTPLKFFSKVKSFLEISSINNEMICVVTPVDELLQQN